LNTVLKFPIEHCFTYRSFVDKDYGYETCMYRRMDGLSVWLLRFGFDDNFIEGTNCSGGGRNGYGRF